MLQEEDYDSDTSDEDFVPQGAVSEDEPISDAEEEEGEEDGDGDEEKKKKKGQGKGKKSSKKKINPLLAYAESAENEKEEENNEEETPKNEEESKEKANNLWADFLADVEDTPKPKPKPKTSSWGALLGNKSKTAPGAPSPSVSKQDTSSSIKKTEDTENPFKKNTVKITKVFEFAGEEVRLEEEVATDSAEAKAALLKQNQNDSGEDSKTSGVKRPGGLASIIGILGDKKQKLSTLEKSRLDWKNFKSCEGIDEELEKHKKSKDGYLEKKAFLERSDIRQFEIERTMRMGKRSNR
ncbi:yeti [Oratosquilla oratoria]|uniref:yeti n=1 Tax=Oratosquilla oratoria TaxID=337810 RepID=UPI003F770863